MILTFKGIDSWDRPVYEDPEGRLWKDTDPREGKEPYLCSACNNEFDGEPDCPFHGDYTFFPFRAVWGHGRQRWKYIEYEPGTYKVCFIDGHDLKWKMFTCEAQNRVEAISKMREMFGANFDHQIAEVFRVGDREQ